MRAEIVKPSPVPPKRRVVDPSACEKGSKISGPFFRRNADPRVGDGEFDAALSPSACLRRDLYHDFTFRRELDGVADEVDEDLAEAARVADEDLGNRPRRCRRPVRALLDGADRQRLERVARRDRAG